MKQQTVWVLVVAAAVIMGVQGMLAPPEKSYKILMLLPISSKSHRNVFMILAEGLADRGHKVVMLTSGTEISNHPNIKEIPYFNSYVISKNATSSLFNNTPGNIVKMMAEFLPMVAREVYLLPAVKEIYKRRKEFDLIVVNHRYNEVVYPFTHEVPFITLSAREIEPSQSAVMGNVINPTHFVKFDSHFLVLAWRRFSNLIQQLHMDIKWRYWTVIPLVQKEISSLFPELPSLLELEKNSSLTLLNTHFSMGPVLPLLPSQVEVGAMHCRPGNPLPQELESWITGAGPDGVIYFSLGSVFTASTLPACYIELFVKAFSRVSQRVLWKFEDELHCLPDNVKISKWLPQQDILAHKNVKVFITHGGLLSLQESIYHATPLLAFPIFSDQPKNALFIEEAGLGLKLAWNELTADSLLKALDDLISNPRYKKEVVKISGRIRDQMLPPREVAVFWTEYVIRHGGAPHLRTSAALSSWIQFLMLDLFFFLLLALLLSIFILRRIVRTIIGKTSGLDGKKRKKD
ncbi:UDP-glycosyltransferase UGT5 isoform X1 [Cherax quadricarinatus]|uniref:UDP-glycosyltransferase UGT5 isoform X1 n=1 Tax=Cherax quadricarinatus TaxID=27406 RepID=UPI00387E604E